MTNDETRFGLLGRTLLGLLLGLLLLIQVDTRHVTPAGAVAAAHLFSIGRWEAANFFDKWPHLLWETLLRKKPSRDERLALIEEYLLFANLAEKEKDRLEGPRRGATTAPGGAANVRITPSREYLDELLETKRKLRPGAEEAIEAELSTVLIGEGLGSRLGLLFPPVDLRFGEPPTMLVTSPRDRIQRFEAVLLTPDLPGLERDVLERELLESYNLSALVFNLAGLSTYPTLVSDLYTRRTILQTAGHEWLHAYFFFRPLGRNLRVSEKMFTLNETAADLAGRELGDTTFARMGGDLSVSARRYLSGAERDPVFAREMRETRLRVDELLGQGDVEDAEQYLKERWWRLVLGGYGLRKLNQAYFAFHGSYAGGAASISPIGDQLKELRGLLPNVGTFVETVSGVSSYQEFLDLLARLRADAGGEPSSRTRADPSGRGAPAQAGRR